jgi:hypothetical protein
MSDEKQKSDGWSHAPMIVGWNNDGSLQTVDSWNVKLTLTDEEREAVEAAANGYELDGDDDECASTAATLRGLLERLGGGV